MATVSPACHRMLYPGGFAVTGLVLTFTRAVKRPTSRIRI